MITPVRGFSGLGAQVPIPDMCCWFAEVGDSAPIAVDTAFRPLEACPVVTMGVLLRTSISPRASTRPAATLVPPISTPTTTLFSFFICFVTTVKFNVFFQWKSHDYAIARKYQKTTTANDEECLRRKTCIYKVWTFNSTLSTHFGLRRLRIFSD